VLYPLLQVAALIFAGLLLYRYHRPLLGALRRFDRENRARKVAELRDRTDALAHFRHTIARAEEQVEEVSEITVDDARTGTPATRFLFEGEQFGTKGEAERVRADKVRKLARDFYLELPTALAARRGDGKLR
jgi:hypothetical protein